MKAYFLKSNLVVEADDSAESIALQSWAERRVCGISVLITAPPGFQERGYCSPLPLVDIADYWQEYNGQGDKAP